MKTVLITQRLVQESRYQEERDALDVRWNLFLEKAGLIGIPVPSRIDLDQLISAVNNISGLVIQNYSGQFPIENITLHRGESYTVALKVTDN